MLFQISPASVNVVFIYLTISGNYKAVSLWPNCLKKIIKDIKTNIGTFFSFHISKVFFLKNKLKQLDVEVHIFLFSFFFLINFFGDDKMIYKEWLLILQILSFTNTCCPPPLPHVPPLCIYIPAVLELSRWCHSFTLSHICDVNFEQSKYMNEITTLRQLWHSNKQTNEQVPKSWCLFVDSANKNPDVVQRTKPAEWWQNRKSRGITAIFVLILV